MRRQQISTTRNGARFRFHMTTVLNRIIQNLWKQKVDIFQEEQDGTGKVFTIDKAAEGKEIRIDFSGVYMNASVWVNGEKLGTHPYGYTPFFI